VDGWDAGRAVTNTPDNPDPSRSTSLQSPGYSGNRVRRATSPRYKHCPGVVGVEEGGSDTLEEGRATKDGKLPRKGSTKSIEQLTGLGAGDPTAYEPGNDTKEQDEER